MTHSGVNKKSTKHVRLDAGWHRILSSVAKRRHTTMGALIEACLADYYPQFMEEIRE